MDFLDRIPFLTKHKGKRELIFVILLSGSIMIAGLVMAEIGWLYKDVPTSATPTAIVGTPPAFESTPERAIGEPRLGSCDALPLVIPSLRGSDAQRSDIPAKRQSDSGRYRLSLRCAGGSFGSASG